MHICGQVVVHIQIQVNRLTKRRFCSFSWLTVQNVSNCLALIQTNGQSHFFFQLSRLIKRRHCLSVLQLLFTHFFSSSSFEVKVLLVLTLFTIISRSPEYIICKRKQLEHLLDLSYFKHTYAHTHTHKEIEDISAYFYSCRQIFLNLLEKLSEDW